MIHNVAEKNILIFVEEKKNNLNSRKKICALCDKKKKIF